MRTRADCHCFLQVVGSLAAEKPKPGTELSGILVKKNFNYHIVAPSDLHSKLLSWVY